MNTPYIVHRILILFVLSPSLSVLLACASVPPDPDGAALEQARENGAAMARAMLDAVNYEAWQKKTAAVSWKFRDSHEHFWDRRRGFVEVKWSGHVARFEKNSMRGIVHKEEDQQRLTDAGDLREHLATAQKYFVNDAFWLNPLFHIESPGVKLTQLDAATLKVHYQSGGVTPGDTYIFHIDPTTSLVRSMQIWASTVPVKGSHAHFLQYAESETGVKSARVYDYLVTIDIDDVRMYEQYPAKGEVDRFADLVEFLKK